MLSKKKCDLAHIFLLYLEKQILVMSICEECTIKSSAARTLSKKDLGTLGNNCTQVQFKKGEIIFKQGALSSNIIYLKTGLVKIHISGPSKNQIIKIAKAPSYLGIPTTLKEKINHYSATALGPVSACFIDLETLKHFVYINGKFAYEIIVELCRNELNSFRKSINRSQKNINGRVADALLFFSCEIFNKDTFDLPLSRLELGDYVDTSRETISRTLKQFCNDGILQIRGKNISILNRQSLETISRYG